MACVLDSEYEGDSISGITYELDVSSFPPGFFKDVEYSWTNLTISSASVKRAGEDDEHGGGIISMKKGATATKGRGNGINGNDNGGGPRGGHAEKGGMMFDRSRDRGLAQKFGVR